ncbi:hypothetical protein EJ05DRAFT_142040 [Pseudovirgaria hyperparasitica]|uniref:Sister chromatid cohesion protein n=1 Tax=Pseudovirgaria hyperparasitica TaxID=470096 RepID=A0A6A6VXN8_9PEZI|nr:uncharacterized protein EJ05DRAFT_142040 [Pseudovirgaria hyperparasitica]KAF2754454.1 hypothetical protein EJ05DRAFT_142040 [Pseudovirgaria hyperparasitica]
MESNGQPHQQYGAQLPFRPPTVEEALPYTPLSSITPFSPDVIAYPSAVPSSRTSIFTSQSERQAANRSLEAWDNEIDAHGNTSEKLQKTLSDLKRLLQSGDTPQYVFKEPHQHASMMATTATTNGKPPAPTNPRLGKFARTVLNATNIRHKYQPSAQANGNTKSRQSSTPVSQVPTQAVRTQRVEQNGAITTHTNRVPSQQNIGASEPARPQVAPQKTPTVQHHPSSSTPTVLPKIKSEGSPSTPSPAKRPIGMVVIPVKRASASATPTKQQRSSTPQSVQPVQPNHHVQPVQPVQPVVQAPVPRPAPSIRPGQAQVILTPGPKWNPSQRSEWKKFPELDAMVQSRDEPLSQERRDEYDTSQAQDRTKTRDVTVQALEDFLEEVFELEDAGDDAHSAANATRLLTTISVDGLDTQTLTTEGLKYLDSHLQKVVKEKQFGNLSEDFLRRAQKLCEGYARSVPEIDLRVSDDWSMDKIAEFDTRVVDLNDGLEAVKVLLRIMVAAGNNITLCPEEMLKAVIAAVKHTLDTLIIPVVESHTRAGNNIMRTIQDSKSNLPNVLMRVGNALKMLEQLFANMTINEEVRSSVEDLAIRLLFVENASSEQNAPLGLQKFELLRKRAMDLVAGLFQCYPSQRDTIVRYVLSSLSSLPVTPQQARHFKTPGGCTIQVVTALFIRFVQSSASRPHRASETLSLGEGDYNSDVGQNMNTAATNVSDSDADGESDDDMPQTTKPKAVQQSSRKPSLEAMVNPLVSAATSMAKSIVGHMFTRSLEASKSGDSPYQKLLELFVEDLVAIFVLDSCDWPGATTLLRVVCGYSLNVYSNDNYPVANRTLSLDIMGQLAGAIYDLQKAVRRDTRILDPSESPMSAKLSQLGENVINNDVGPGELYAFEGPYRLCIEYIHGSTTKDLRLHSGRGFFLSTWAAGILEETKKEDASKEFAALAQHLRNALADPQWLTYKFEFPMVPKSYANLAAAVVAMQSEFGSALPTILTHVLASCASTSTSTKNRGLKALERLAIKDPLLLTQNPKVIPYIRRMAYEDPSAQIRDTALQLLQTCFSQDRTMDKDLYSKLIEQARVDPSANPKKRCMRFLKDIYQRNDDVDMRSSIAGLFMNRILDLEELIVKLAKESLEELWISPFRGARDARLNVTFKSNVTLIVSALQQDDWLVKPFGIWINSLLDEKSKSRAENAHVLKDLVANLFESFGGNTSIQRQISILKAIAVFAKANPQLLNRPQLNSLTPFLKNIQTLDDADLFFPTVEIFNATLKTLISSSKDSLLEHLDKSLGDSLARLSKVAVRQVAICMDILSGYLTSTQQKCLNITSSVISNLKKNEPSNPSSKVRKWLTLLGVFGNAHDYAPHLERFRTRFPHWKGASVLSLFVDEICPRTSPKFDKEVRVAAFEAIGLISLRKPKELNRDDVLSAMRKALEDSSSGLDITVLEVLRDFFQSEEKRSETGAVIAVGKGAVQGAERMGTSLNASDNDGVITTLARNFLQPVKHIALSTTDDRAPVAVSILVSISRQGLVIPNECIPAFIALETSDKDSIAVPVFKEHESVHQKHESIVAKEYYKGVLQSYQYQMDNFSNSRGAKFEKDKAAIPKLKYLFSIIKGASSKVRKDFFKVAATKLQFAFDDFQSTGDEPQDLYFPQYVLENLLAAEYVQNIELITLTDNLLKIFSSTGTIVAEVIEREVLSSKTMVAPAPTDLANVTATTESTATDFDGTQPGPNGELVATAEPPHLPAVPDLDLDRLRHLTAASMVLSLILETCNWLKRAYSLEKAKAKKDQHLKAPFRTNFISADKYGQQSEQIMSSLDSRESMISQCRSFCQAVALDSEHKVGSDDEEMADATNHAGGYMTPEEGDESGSDKSRTPGSARGRKRKGSLSGGSAPTPKKRRGRPSGAPGKKTQSKKAGQRSTSSGFDGPDG